MICDSKFAQHTSRSERNFYSLPPNTHVTFLRNVQFDLSSQPTSYRARPSHLPLGAQQQMSYTRVTKNNSYFASDKFFSTNHLDNTAQTPVNFKYFCYY